MVESVVPKMAAKKSVYCCCTFFSRRHATAIVGLTGMLIMICKYLCGLRFSNYVECLKRPHPEDSVDKVLQECSDLKSNDETSDNLKKRKEKNWKPVVQEWITNIVFFLTHLGLIVGAWKKSAGCILPWLWIAIPFHFITYTYMTIRLTITFYSKYRLIYNDIENVENILTINFTDVKKYGILIAGLLLYGYFDVWVMMYYSDLASLIIQDSEGPDKIDILLFFIQILGFICCMLCELFKLLGFLFDKFSKLL